MEHFSHPSTHALPIFHLTQKGYQQQHLDYQASSIAYIQLPSELL